MARVVPLLENLALDAIVANIGTTVQKLTDMDGAVSKETFETYFESCLKLLKERLEYEVPWNLYDIMVRRSLSTINLLMMSRILTKRKVEIFCRFSEVFMTPKLKHVNISFMPQNIKTTFLKNTPLMTGLEKIHFTQEADSEGEEDDVVEDVTDDMVSSLRECPKLRGLYVNTSSEGFAKLLLGLPYLEYVNPVHHGALGNFQDILEELQKSGEFKEPFRIKDVTMADFTTDQFILLEKMCPMVTFIRFDLDSCKPDLSVVKTLNHLTNVMFVDFEFYEHGIDKFLESCGSKIVFVSLQRSSSIDSDALMCINRCCPNLRELRLDDLRSEDTFESFIELRVPPFKHLKDISIRHDVYCSECMDSLVKFILSRCFNIEKLYFSSLIVNEDTLKRVMSVNPLNKLKELVIFIEKPSHINTSMKKIIKILRDKNSELGVDVRAINARNTL